MCSLRQLHQANNEDERAAAGVALELEAAMTDAAEGPADMMTGRGGDVLEEEGATVDDSASEPDSTSPSNPDPVRLCTHYIMHQIMTHVLTLGSKLHSKIKA